MTDQNRKLHAIIIEAIDHAALCGTFDPRRFLFDAKGVEASVLAKLGRSCNEMVAANGHVMWRMRDHERARRLLALASDPNTLRRRYRKRPPLKKDVFAQALRLITNPRARLSSEAVDRLISQRLSGAPSRKLTILREVIAAFTFAAPLLEGEQVETAREIEHALLARIVRASIASRQHQILPNGLCGREAERAAVLDFIVAKADPEADFAFQQPIQTFRKPMEDSNYRSLLITGSPGMGKSAFLTDLVQRLKQVSQDPVVFSFDFDQMTLAHGGRTAWTAEVTRQLAICYPHRSGELSAMRGRISQMWSRSEGSHDTTQAEDLMQGALDIMRDEHGLQGRPIVVLLDTLEEITAQDNPDDFQNYLNETTFYYLDTWAEQLGRLNGGGGVAAIFSGRNAPPVHDDDVPKLFHAHLILRELESDPAAELLIRLEPRLTLQNHANVVAGIGGHPLLLILVAKQLRLLDSEDLAEEVAELKRVKLRGVGSDTALRTLYSRFLDRMRMPRLPQGLSEADIHKLAHPGLLLREVTAELLKDVVAPAVDVFLDGPGYAEASFRALSEQIWLVDRSQSGQSVTHNRDVRRIMLPIMLNDPKGAAERLLRKGIDYFEKRDQVAEAGYLRCLRGETDWLLTAPLGVADEIYGFVGAQDISLFDLPVAAAIKHLAHSAGVLSDEELAALPPAFQFQESLDQDSKTVIGTGQGRDHWAKSAPEVTQPARDLYDILTDEKLERQIANDFVTGEWTRAYETGWDALLNNTGWHRLEQPVSTQTPFHQSWLWRLTLISMHHGPRLEGDLYQISQGNYRAVLSDDVQIYPDSCLFDIDMLVRTHFKTNEPDAEFIEGLGLERYNNYLVNLRMMRFMAQSPLLRTSIKQRKSPVRIALGSRTHAFLSQLMSDKSDFISISNDAVRNKKAERNTLPKLLVETLREGGQHGDISIEEIFERFSQAAFGDAGQFVAVADVASSDQFKAFVIGQIPEVHEPVASAVAVAENHLVLQALLEVIASGAIWPKDDPYSQFFADKSRRSTQEKFEVAGDLVARLDLVGVLPDFVHALYDLTSDKRLFWVRTLFTEIENQWTPISND